MTERTPVPLSEPRPLLTALVHDHVIAPDVAETIFDAIDAALNVAWASTWDDNGESEAETYFREVFYRHLREARS